MNQRSDIGRVLRHWFEDGPDSMPDRVVDTVAARISVNRQRRVVHLVGRTAHVNRIFTYLAAAAAVIIAAFAIWQFLPASPANVAGQPTPTPAASPSAAPSASARYPAWYPPAAVADANGAGIMAAGTHETSSFTPAFRFSVPEGWVNTHDESNYFALFPDTPANQAQHARSDELAQSIFMGVHPSPWFTCESAESNSGATAAEKVAAMTANEVMAVSGVVDVTIGGLTGKQFDVWRSPDWTGTCPGDSDLPAGVDPEDERTRGLLLDVPRGVLVIFMYSMSSADFEAFLAEAMPIVESFEFDLGQ